MDIIEHLRTLSKSAQAMAQDITTGTNALRTFAENHDRDAVADALSPPRCIWRHQSVIEWDLFLAQAMMYRPDTTRIDRAPYTFNNFSKLGSITTTEGAALDIQQVDGMTCSKGEDTPFATMAAFSSQIDLSNRGIDLNDKSLPMLRKILSNRDIRIMHDPRTTDLFSCHLWDGRIFLSQSGGSHHFAAAQFLSREMDINLLITGKLVTHQLDSAAIREVTSKYHIFAVKNASEFHELHDAMSRCNTSFIATPIPLSSDMEANKGSHLAIMIDAHSTEGRRTWDILRDHVFDLGDHLKQLFTEQNNNRLSLRARMHNQQIKHDDWMAAVGMQKSGFAPRLP